MPKNQPPRDPLDDIWKRFSSNERIGNVATVHRGIEWRPLPEPRRQGNRYNKRFQERYTSLHELEGYRRGVALASGMKAFRLPEIKYLSFRADDQRPTCEGIFRYPWDQPKVAVSASRVSRDRWRVVACPDNDSLAFTQRFILVWPKPPWTPNSLAAAINGPVASAYFYTSEANRDNLTDTLKNVPLPRLGVHEIHMIDGLVAEYMAAMVAERSNENDDLLKRLLLKVDAAVLKGYGLPPRLERTVLDFFRGSERPVKHSFGDYFPKSFESFIPLWMYISNRYNASTAEDFLANVPEVDDPALIDSMMDSE